MQPRDLGSPPPSREAYHGPPDAVPVLLREGAHQPLHLHRRISHVCVRGEKFHRDLVTGQQAHEEGFHDEVQAALCGLSNTFPRWQPPGWVCLGGKCRACQQEIAAFSPVAWPWALVVLQAAGSWVLWACFLGGSRFLRLAWAFLALPGVGWGPNAACSFC